MEDKRETAKFKILALTVTACLICSISDGIRNNYGIMLPSILESAGMSYAAVSLMLATGQLFFGLVQPFFGSLSEKKGSVLTLLLGLVMITSGLQLLPRCRTSLSLFLCLGFLLPAGTGACSYSIVVGALSPKLPRHLISFATSIVNASSGVGNALLSPVVQRLLAKGGLGAVALVLTVPVLLLLPLCVFLGRRGETKVSKDAGEPDAFPKILRSRTYQLLMLGFFTCGFHMSLISNHLPSQFQSYGISGEVSALAFSAYGFVTMGGSVISGVLTTKRRKKNVLAFYYGSRTVITALFLCLPKTALSVFSYAILLGLTGAATVTPVTGILTDSFGPKRVGTLYGFVFFVHQLGAFLGAYGCGLVVDSVGSYVPIWCIDMALAAFASSVSFLIRD